MSYLQPLWRISAVLLYIAFTRKVYAPNQVGYAILFVLLSASKGWAILSLLFVVLPIYLLWMIVWGLATKSNLELREKYAWRVNISAILHAVTTIGLDDTSGGSAFTFIQTDSNSGRFQILNFPPISATTHLVSSIETASVIISIVAFIAFCVFAISGFFHIPKNPQIKKR